MHKFMIAFSLFVVSGLLGTVAADDSRKPSAELQVLEDMIGTWDEVMTIKPTERVPAAEEATAVTKRVWSLGGTFIRGEGSWQGQRILIFMHSQYFRQELCVHHAPNHFATEAILDGMTLEKAHRETSQPT